MLRSIQVVESCSRDHVILVITTSQLEWNAALVADGTSRKYGDGRHVATGCNSLVRFNEKIVV